MDVIPAIDIRGGRCVRLEQGDYERETVFGVDPVAMALHWVGQGASRIHVVDLDAAREGRPVNDAVIRRIVGEAGVPVQVAGGVRDHAAIHRWAEAGADRVVVGTLAVEQPAEIDRAMDEASGQDRAVGGRARRQGRREGLARDQRTERRGVPARYGRPRRAALHLHGHRPRRDDDTSGLRRAGRCRADRGVE